MAISWAITASGEDALTAAVVRLASLYGRYGYRWVTALLRAEGRHVNHKHVERSRRDCAKQGGTWGPPSALEGLQADHPFFGIVTGLN